MKSIDACEHRAWSILTWRRGTGENPQTKTFRCRSWRHEGQCRNECGACDFRRIDDAVKLHDFWTYVVLTYPHRLWPVKEALFRFGLVSWSRLRKTLTRAFGALGYIQTWETHRSGWPHVNVLITNPRVYALANGQTRCDRPDWLKPLAVQAGFGPICYAEAMRDGSKMAGYLTKLALELAGAAHKNQTPVNAPRHFRRIRASRGMLAKRFKDPDITGQLFRVPLKCLQAQLNGNPT